MYYQVISQCSQSLKNIEAWLDKAELSGQTPPKHEDNENAMFNGQNRKDCYLREQGLGSSNLPAPTIVLNDLAKSLFSRAPDLAPETEFEQTQQSGLFRWDRA